MCSVLHAGAMLDETPEDYKLQLLLPVLDDSNNGIDETLVNTADRTCAQVMGRRARLAQETRPA